MWILEISKFSTSSKQEILSSIEFNTFTNLVNYIEQDLEGKCYDAYPFYWTVKYHKKYRLATAYFVD